MKKIGIAIFVVLDFALSGFADVPFPPTFAWPVIGTVEPIFSREFPETNRFSTLFWGGPAFVYPILPPWIWANLELELAGEKRFYFFSTKTDGWFAGLYGGLGIMLVDQPVRYGYANYLISGLTAGVKVGYKFAFDIQRDGSSLQRIDLEPYISGGTTGVFAQFVPAFTLAYYWVPLVLTAGFRIVYEIQ